MTDTIDEELRAIERSIADGGPEPEFVTAFRDTADASDHWLATQVSGMILLVLSRAIAMPAPPRAAGPRPLETQRLQLVALLREETAQCALASSRLRARGSSQLAERLERLVKVLPTLEGALVGQMMTIIESLSGVRP